MFLVLNLGLHQGTFCLGIRQGIIVLPFPKTELLLSLEHDHMLYSGNDRQSRAFHNELIDEFDYLKCPCHDTSELHNGPITDNPNGSLTIRGLRSPCPNSRYFAYHEDRVGQVIYSFDGTFTTECEREMYYVEIMARRLSTTDNVIAMDTVKSCGITKPLLLLQTMLGDFGYKKKLPHSVMRVDEDFYCMCCKQGANDDSSRGQ